MAATAAPPRDTIATTSASSDSATRSTAPTAAAASVANDDTAARNSASFWADQPGGIDISGDRQDDECLVVEADHPLFAGDLPVRVEASDRSTTGALHDLFDLHADPLVAEHGTSADALEREHAERGVAPERRERVLARGVAGPPDGLGVAFHEPDERRLRYLRDARE